jgi:hypothetical protein
MPGGDQSALRRSASAQCLQQGRAGASRGCKKKLLKRPGRRFYFRLAALLGCTVRELTNRLDAAELVEWIAYDQLEPFGEGRLVLQQAMMMRQQAGRDANVETTDLVPYFRPPPPPPAVELSESERRALSDRMTLFFKRKAGVA